jgi:predicted Rossmann-fold nucleotide-binding protein
VQKDLPIVLFGEKFWRSVVNWEALVEYAVIAEADYKSLFFTDSVDDAVGYIVKHLSGAEKA